MSGHLPIQFFWRLPACFCDDIFNHILVPPPKIQFGINVYWVIGKFKVPTYIRTLFDSRKIQVSNFMANCTLWLKDTHLN